MLTISHQTSWRETVLFGFLVVRRCVVSKYGELTSLLHTERLESSSLFSNAVLEEVRAYFTDLRRLDRTVSQLQTGNEIDDEDTRDVICDMVCHSEARRAIGSKVAVAMSEGMTAGHATVRAGGVSSFAGRNTAIFQSTLPKALRNVGESPYVLFSPSNAKD